LAQHCLAHFYGQFSPVVGLGCEAHLAFIISLRNNHIGIFR
jgi:hypothetical protein